jgi:hypothetical protein
MPQIGQLQEAMAARALQFGALGIGENHEERQGRDLAIRLIVGGHVKRLFVELSPGAYGPMIQNATGLAPQGYAAVRGALGLSSLHVCPIALEDVIATAIVHGATVHCVDHRRAMQIGYASSPSGMRLRNSTITSGVQEETETQSARDGGASGSLLLFGGAHFEGGGSIAAMYPDLQWIKAG